jgi:hypothetical protein
MLVHREHLSRTSYYKHMLQYNIGTVYSRIISSFKIKKRHISNARTQRRRSSAKQRNGSLSPAMGTFVDPVVDEESRLTADETQERNFNLGQRWGGTQFLLGNRKTCYVVAAAIISVAVGILVFHPHSVSSVNAPHEAINWPEPWMQELPKCQTTLIKPFRMGCPATCKRAVDVNETMYRMHAAWYFGQARLFPESELPIAYDMGINYQAPRAYIENFIEAAQEVNDAAYQSLPPNITVAFQKDIHMSMAYLCCLRKNETYWVREIMKKWVNQRRPFQFHVQFNKLECWHERFNSATNIMVGDEATQQIVMKYVHELYDAIEDHGIHMEVLREQQMPIHATLVGLQYGEGEQVDPQYDIRPQLDAIYEIVAPISKAFGDSWTGGGSEGMTVSHDPRISDGEWHAGAKP